MDTEEKGNAVLSATESPEGALPEMGWSQTESPEKAMISVVVPVYNAEHFLEGTAESILAQTDPHYEILLVNDGSEDGSLSVCRTLAARDARIRVINQENRGVSAARNRGIREARGAYVCFVDSDDYVTPSFVSDLRGGMVRMWAQGHRDVQVQIGREEIDEEGSALPQAITPPKEPVLIDPAELVRGMLLYTGDASFCTKLTPRRLLLRYPFEEGALAEDFGLQVRMTDALEGIYSLPQVDYRVVHRAGSLTRRKDTEHFSRVYVSIVEAADYVEGRLVPGRPELAVPAKRFSLYERLEYLLHVPIADMSAENTFYQSVLRYLRREENRRAIRENPYLDRKSRIYLRLLSTAPRTVRRIHRLTMRLRGIR